MYSVKVIVHSALHPNLVNVQKWAVTTSGETSIYGKNKRSRGREKEMCAGQKMSPGVRRERRKEPEKL